MVAKPHENLEVWKQAMSLVKSVYEMTSLFPVEERYGLSQQMRRAAVSIPSNIAEGAGRNGPREFLNFVGIARGSLAELETQMQLAVMLDFASPDHLAFDLAETTGKLLTGLHKKLGTSRFHKLMGIHFDHFGVLVLLLATDYSQLNYLFTTNYLPLTTRH